MEYCKSSIAKLYLTEKTPVCYLDIPVSHLEYFLEKCDQEAMIACLEEFGTSFYNNFEQLEEYFGKMVSKYMLDLYNIDYPSK